MLRVLILNVTRGVAPESEHVSLVVLDLSVTPERSRQVMNGSRVH